MSFLQPYLIHYEPLKDPEPKNCPVCNQPMDYQPVTHWTGLKFIPIQHKWACHKNDQHGNEHVVYICKRLSLKP